MKQVAMFWTDHGEAHMARNQEQPLDESQEGTEDLGPTAWKKMNHSNNHVRELGIGSIWESSGVMNTTRATFAVSLWPYILKMTSQKLAQQLTWPLGILLPQLQHVKDATGGIQAWLGEWTREQCTDNHKCILISQQPLSAAFQAVQDLLEKWFHFISISSHHNLAT